MPVTLQKWGNSVGVRLPKPMLEQVGLKEGAQVEVQVEGDHLVIRRRKLKLADLLAQCKPENSRTRLTGGLTSDAKSYVIEPYVPERGDFARMVLDPYTGREQGGERPVLVLSTKAFSQTTRYALIAPITRTIRNWPFEVPIGPDLRVAGAVLTDQTRSVDFIARHAKFLGKAPSDLTEAVLARVASILED